jgi:hypothetical protein
MPLTRPDYYQLAGVESNVERSTLTNAVYQRTIVAEIPLWTPESQYLKSVDGNNPYPGAFGFDDVTGELFVVLQGTVAKGSAVFVYDIVEGSRTWPLKRVFYLGSPAGETLVIRWVGGQRYLYSLKFPSKPISESNVFRVNITTLPAMYGTATGLTDYPEVRGHSQMAFDGDRFIVQSRRIFKAQAQRNVFDLWNDTLTTKVGEVDFNWAVTGRLATPYSEHFQKTQGLAVHNGTYVFGVGGDYITGSHNPDDAYLHQGIVICGADGRRLAEGLCRPDEFIRIRDTDPNGLSYSGTMVENEGVGVYRNELHALWVCTHSPAAETPPRLGQGFIITRELSQDRARIDFRPAARVVPTWDPERFGIILHQPEAAPLNPITGESMDTFVKICTFMRDAGVSQFRFLGVGNITDLLGNSIDCLGCFVEVLNGNGSTFLITLTHLSPAKCRSFWIYSNITSQSNMPDTRYT